MASPDDANDTIETSGSNEADLAQAFKDLARGERTATALEQQLSQIEKKLEELLERADQDKAALEAEASKSGSDKK